MQNIVEIEKRDLITNSLVIAEGIGYEHRTVLKLIREHEIDLKEFGIISLGVRKSKRGKPTEFYNLSESQTYFLLTLMQNNESVTKFKKELVKEFMRMRKALISVQVRHQNEEWKLKREASKVQRLETTDAIKLFVEYAVKQGSSNAITYYSNITQMEYRALFLLKQKFPNLKDYLNMKQLNVLEIADTIVEDTLKEGMELEMHYKDIFKLAKERVESFAKIMKPSIVITMEEIKLLD
jgi:phage regulator Rha-like protein